MLLRDYCVTFELTLAHPFFPCECEFKGHAIIALCARGEPGNKASIRHDLFNFLGSKMCVHCKKMRN